MPVTETQNRPAMQHFLRLVRQGRHSGCSISERSCSVLAAAIVKGVPGLDDEAIQGLTELIGLAQYAPSTARELLNLP